MPLAGAQGGTYYGKRVRVRTAELKTFYEPVAAKALNAAEPVLLT